MGLYIIYIASFFYTGEKFLNDSEINVIGKIVSLKEENEYFDKYILKIIKNQNYNEIKNKKVIIYVEKSSLLLPGDIIKLNGIFNKAEVSRNYKGFDNKKYLLQNKIFGSIRCDKVEKIGETKNIFTNILLMRNEFCNKINIIFEKDNSDFLKGLLFGKVDELSENVKENFKISNISHILAISGMHVTYVLITIKFIISKTINNKKLKNCILLMFIYVFYIISGSSVSCLRACIMLSMQIIASSSNRKNNFYLSFIFSFILILLINPYNIFNIGMWLSYLGTLGIVLFYRFLNRIFEKKNLRNSKKEKNIVNNHFYKIVYFIKMIKKRIIEYVINNFSISMSAQILIFPIMIYSFNTISLTFFISNILVSVFVPPALILGYISILLSYIPIPIYRIVLWLEKNIIFIIIEIGELCSMIPFSRIYIKTPNFIFIILYYLIILIFVFIFYKKRYYCLKLILCFRYFKKEIIKFNKFIISKLEKSINLNKANTQNIQNDEFIKQTKVKKYILKCNGYKFFIGTICIIIIISVFSKKELKIYFVDVGQGDCTVIQTPNKKNIIIDGGDGNTENKYDYGEHIVLPYLLDRGINKIDYMIISHCDSDHIGGLFYILENIKVNEIFIGVQPKNSEQFEELLSIVKKKNVKIVFLNAGDIVNLDEEVKLEVLWPIRENLIQENPLNNNSLVFKLYYKKYSILFTGDIEMISEKEIINRYDNKKLKSTIIKISHHGSKTSTTKTFIEKVNPQIALIGVGKNNKFGHPSESVLNTLKKENIKIYRTDLNGEIIIKIFENILIKTMFKD